MQSVCCTHDIGPLLGALIGTLLCPVPGVSTLVAEIYWFCSVHYVTGHVRVQERKYFIGFFSGWWLLPIDTRVRKPIISDVTLLSLSSPRYRNSKAAFE